nr:hypothetical protein [uncultured Carboxylicivirga sp.]
MKISLIIIFVFLLQNIFGQQPFPFEFLQKNDYFNAYTELVNKQKDYRNDKFEGQYWEALGTIYCFMSREEKAMKCFHLAGTIKKQLPSRTKNLDNESLISFDSIFSLVDNYNVIMLNEAHHITENRAMLYHLLPILKQKGFTQLALEALNSGAYMDSLLEKRGYPIYQKTGIYINDPVYANTIRLALKLGFTLIPYESYNSNREEEQANNIFNQFVPEQGKLIVYGGYAHISKRLDRKLMGSFFKKKINEDYLSLSQVISGGFNDKDCKDDLEYKLVADPNRHYDYFLIRPKQVNNQNIPKWYNLMDFKYVSLTDYYNNDFATPALVQIYYKDEENGIPIYQYLIENDSERNILLAFPESGDFKLVIENNNNTIEKQIIFDENNNR